MLNKKTQERVDRLFKLGLIFNGESCILDDFNVHWTEISCETDDKFDKIVSSIKKEMTRRASKKKTVLFKCTKDFWLKEGARSTTVAFRKDNVYECVFENIQELRLYTFTANDQDEEHTLEEADIEGHFDTLTEEQIYNLSFSKLDLLSNLNIKVMDCEGGDTGLLPLNAASITALEIFLKRYRKFVEEYCCGTYENE